MPVGTSMRVIVVLPPDFADPIGGYAVAYQYANRLAARGHRVSVLHIDPTPWADLARRPVRVARQLGRRFGRAKLKPVSWFAMSDAVDVRTVPALRPSDVQDADAVVATAWRTAEDVAALGLGPARSFYLIQHFEDWDGPRAEVEATWRLPITKIAISDWLVDKAAELDALPIAVVRNGVDEKVFRTTVPPEDRNPATVTMMWHEKEWKGSDTGLEGLRKAQARVPELKVSLFSFYEPPADLPDWISFHRGLSGPTLSALHNQNAIFLAPSVSEGSPLPITEAFASGCAVVATDIPGVAGFAFHDKTALLVPVGDSDAMAEAIVTLVRDPARRIALAHAGNDFALGELSWDKCCTNFEAVLRGEPNDLRTSTVA